MSYRKKVTELFGEIGGAIDQTAEIIGNFNGNWDIKKKYTIVFTCGRCGRRFNRPVPLDHVCATIIETTARDMPPKTLLLPEVKGD